MRRPPRPGGVLALEVTVCDLKASQLLGRQLKHEVFGEAREVALDGLNENPRLYPIELRQVGVEHHPLLTQRQDAALDHWLQRRHRALA